MNNETKRQNELADSLVQKLERVKSLWAELPTQDDLEELEKHADGVAGRLEDAREIYMDAEFPTVESLQELAKEAALMAESVERCGGDGPLHENAEPTAPWPNQAKAAAEFFGSCMMHHHRGVFDCGDKIIVFGNDGCRTDARVQREVEMVRDHLEKLNLPSGEFATEEDGYSWAIVVPNYQGAPVDIDELRKKLGEIWGEVCKAK
jgi:hypothetical protein